MYEPDDEDYAAARSLLSRGAPEHTDDNATAARQLLTKDHGTGRNVDAEPAVDEPDEDLLPGNYVAREGATVPAMGPDDDHMIARELFTGSPY